MKICNNGLQLCHLLNSFTNIDVIEYIENDANKTNENVMWNLYNIAKKNVLVIFESAQFVY